MSEEKLKVDPSQAVGQEAELAAQNMAEGQEQAPQVDVDRDYEASKEYSVSDVDKSGAGGRMNASTTNQPGNV
ncbi:MAG TPA: hypothetical protein V6C91_01355 [Coleofasciculaceae cyanobacterium]